MGNVIRIILTSIFAICGVVMTIIVLMQEGKSAGLGTIGGMSDTFWEKNKARSKEGILENITRILAIAFIVIAFILTFAF